MALRQLLVHSLPPTLPLCEKNICSRGGLAHGRCLAPHHMQSQVHVTSPRLHLMYRPVGNCSLTNCPFPDLNARPPTGTLATRAGPIMAASDRFNITLRGRGGHGAMPHLAADPVVAAAALVLALQTLVGGWLFVDLRS